MRSELGGGRNVTRIPNFSVVVNQRWSSSKIDSMRLDDGTILATLEEIHEGEVQYF